MITVVGLASMPKSPKSARYMKAAMRRMVGGVNSPVRAFGGVGGIPVAIAKAKGAYIWDLDGKRRVDYVLSWGPLVLGHAPVPVLSALRKTMTRGTSFGASHPLELELAEAVCKLMPSLEKIRFVSSGTEATLSALRLARGITGRDDILKFEGCYHGHGDSLLAKAGSGIATLGLPGSPGVPKDFAKHTLTLPYNDSAGVKALFKRHGRKIAAVIVEPVAGNMGLVLPQAGFLETLRAETRKAGALLIFDEVMTGFRVSLAGAQGRYGIKPDLTCLGKVIGGGLPVGALGGSARFMNQLAPLGPVYQAGTLSGNPLAMAAGLATLKSWSKPGVFQKAEAALSQLCQGWSELFAEAHLSARVTQAGTMFGIYFSALEVTDFEGAKRSDVAFFKHYFHAMLDEGVYLAPSAFEAGFMSSAHSPQVLRETLTATRRALVKLGYLKK